MTTTDQFTLNSQASAMFDAMQRVFEDRSAPVVGSYPERERG